MTQPVQINLSAFKENRPDHAHYFEYIEQNYADPTGERFTEVCPDLPVPTRLVREGSLMSPFSLLKPDHPQFADALANLCDYAKLVHKFDIATFTHYYMNKFKDLKPNLLRHMPTVDAHDFFVCRIIENLHYYNQAPVIKYHDDLIDLLSTTKVDKSGKIPCKFMRAPQDMAYYDFTSAKKLPEAISNGEVLPIVGMYVVQSTLKASDAEEVLRSDPTMKRAMERGTIKTGDDDEIICLNFQLVGESPRNQKLDEGYLVMTYALAFSPDTEFSIKEVIAAHLPEKEEGTVYADDVVLFEHIKQPLDLVLNTILYLTTDEAHREQIKIGTDLEVQIKRTSKAKKKRTLTKEYTKTAQEFTRIGKQYRLLDTEGKPVKSGKMETHRRDGHWRAQHYGTANSLVKVIWIKPMTIGAGSAKQKNVLVQ
jgi:hypothetical protein